jgi:hypothetical protein
MGISGTVSNRGISEPLALPDAYRALNERRRDIDRRITALESDDPARAVLWQELETVLGELRAVVDNLAKSPAADLSELRDKAGVLASLLRAGRTGEGPTFPEDDHVALALSLTDDVARLSAE